MFNSRQNHHTNLQTRVWLWIYIVIQHLIFNVPIWLKKLPFMTLLFICYHNLALDPVYFRSVCRPTQDQEVILILRNPNKPVPSCSSQCSLVSGNSSWEVTGRVSPHLSEPDWLPYSHSYRLLPSHSLTPMEGLREDKERKMRRVVSLWERTNKQIEERKERKAEVACEDVWTIVPKYSYQNSILIHTSCCQHHQKPF